MNIKYWEEKAKEKGKLLLVENYQLSVKPSQIEVLETPKLIESKGEKYKARAIIKNVKTSKFTENLNGRIYPRELDEKLIKEKLPEGTLSLADHPKDDDGSIKDIAGVWHNARIDENFSYGDWYLVGEHGQTIKEAIEAGGRIGVSRVGYGEFLEDGKTVNKDTYELERWGDAVINPSQQVFATYENIEESIKEDNKIEEKNDILKETITNNINKEIVSKENIEQDNIKEVNNMDKYMELNHRNQIKEAVRQAKGKEDLKEGIEILSSIETESEDLKKLVDDEIKSLQVKLNEQKDNALSALDEKTKEFDELQEKYDTAVKVVDELKAKVERGNKIQEIFEIAEDTDIDALTEAKKKFSEEYQILCENVDAMKKDLDNISAIFEDENFKNMEIATLEDIKNLVEDTMKRDSDLEYLHKSLEEAEKAIEEREKKLEEFGVVFEDDLKEKKACKKEQEDEDEDEDDEDDDEKKKDDDKDMKEQEGDDEEDDDEEDDDEEEIKEKKKGKKKESSRRSDIKIFVEREIGKNSSLKDIRDQLVKCDSLSEVIDKIDIYNSKSKEDMVKFKESSDRKEERKVEKYVFSYRR